jgi:hypothetical protein
MAPNTEWMDTNHAYAWCGGMERHRRVQDLTTGVGEERLPERRGGIAQRQRPLGEPSQRGLDEREIEEEEIPLVEGERAQENGRAHEELIQCEDREQRESRSARSFVEVGHLGD